ncbi:outer membrane beta-barrel protein [Microbulbifer sp. EKSA008]|uniref:outer membrane beta-barrel protein n=1 Tax=unclassified Microbulbifer TaxID=2619833 RepID=UPI0024AC88D1|nr:outer membrane beta-barrel protein [Microbulbifer sp. VAAF005]WHI44946.1 outer membrane beta-barrel protein [Microbulbifer sp. VAAF005]
MRRRDPLLSFLYSLPFILLFTVSEVRADFVGTLNLYVNGGKHWFDGDRLQGTPFRGFEMRDTSGVGAGFGFNMTNHWAMEGVVDYFVVSVADTPEKVDVYNYRIDLLYQFGGQFCGNFCWQPYVAFGLGEMRINYDRRYRKKHWHPDDPKYVYDPDHPYDPYYPYPWDCRKKFYVPEDRPDGHHYPYPPYHCDWHDRQNMVNVGMGIKYHLGPRWQARADIRLFQGVEEGGVDGFASLAVGYQWLEYPDFWYDEDADGVIDATDQCPQTPVGIDVQLDGCPLDTDFDGVPSYIDQCPNTPIGIAVDEYGCIR